jgi:hypothetical protein
MIRFAMPNERVIEIPWAMMQLPQKGVVLDIGSWSATYLDSIPTADRKLHCLDPQDCRDEIPSDAVFHHQSIIGNSLPRYAFDCVLLLSTIEHIGLPTYGQNPFPDGDRLTLAEVAQLLTPQGYVVVTVPAGVSKITSWYRQYSPSNLSALFTGWDTQITYWGIEDEVYTPIDESNVESFSYRYGWQEVGGAGAIAGVIARPLRNSAVNSDTKR